MGVGGAQRDQRGNELEDPIKKRAKTRGFFPTLKIFYFILTSLRNNFFVVLNLKAITSVFAQKMESKYVMYLFLIEDLPSSLSLSRQCCRILSMCYNFHSSFIVSQVAYHTRKHPQNTIFRIHLGSLTAKIPWKRSKI